MTPMAERWARRIERAAVLEKRHPSTAAILRFYRDLAQFQSDRRIGPDVRQHLPALLALVRRKGTAVLAEKADYLASHSEEWDALLEHRDDLVSAFFIRAIEQPYFEQKALESRVDKTT